jgi:hypothetical protein
MSFFRHEEIYRPDGGLRARQLRSGLEAAPQAHRSDEFPAGYSLAGCSPAEPASASPTGPSMRWGFRAGNDLSANGNMSPISASQPRGSLQLLVSIFYALTYVGFGERRFAIYMTGGPGTEGVRRLSATSGELTRMPGFEYVDSHRIVKGRISSILPIGGGLSHVCVSNGEYCGLADSCPRSLSPFVSRSSREKPQDPVHYNANDYHFDTDHIPEAKVTIRGFHARVHNNDSTPFPAPLSPLKGTYREL